MNRITSESDLWLNAIKEEDEGNFFEAFFLYLKDATESLQRNLFVRAALSCSCAANCLSVTGNLAAARRLYLKTAMLYEINGDSIIGESVREALWSYKECYDYYHLGCDAEKAQSVYEKCISLTRRINPFLGEEEVMKSIRKQKVDSIKKNMAQTNMQVSTQVDNAMEDIVKMIESLCSKKNMNQNDLEKNNQNQVKEFEKSLTN